MPTLDENTELVSSGDRRERGQTMSGRGAASLNGAAARPGLSHRASEGTRFDDSAIDSILEAADQYSGLLASADASAIAIYMAIWRASQVQLLANQRTTEGLGLPIKFSPSGLAVLRVLYFATSNRMSISDISKTTRISRMTVLNVVDGLQNAGLVKRRSSVRDRRVRIAQLTESGSEAFLNIVPVMASSMSAACSGFTAHEKELLLGFLRRLYQIS